MKNKTYWETINIKKKCLNCLHYEHYYNLKFTKHCRWCQIYSLIQFKNYKVYCIICQTKIKFQNFEEAVEYLQTTKHISNFSAFTSLNSIFIQIFTNVTNSKIINQQQTMIQLTFTRFNENENVARWIVNLSMTFVKNANIKNWIKFVNVLLIEKSIKWTNNQSKMIAIFQKMNFIEKNKKRYVNLLKKKFSEKIKTKLT